MFKVKKVALGAVICLSLLSTSALSVALSKLAQSSNQGRHNAPNHKETVRCESRKNKRQHCSVNTRNGIKLKKELSRNKCQGNWGTDREGVWVKNGCKADFKVKGSGNGNHRPDHDNNRPDHGYRPDHDHRPDYGNNRPGYGEQEVKCESVKYRKKYCNISNLKKVTLIQVLSKHTPCEGKWGYDNRGIWVNNNCKALFRYKTGGWGNNNNHNNYNNHNNHGSLSPSKTLKCKSRSRGKQICARNVKKANLKREISKGKYPCQNNWGIDRYGDLYVKNNCYAEFKYWD